MNTVTSVSLITTIGRDRAVLVINGMYVASYSYDRHGTAGEDLFRKIAHGIARIANVYPHEEEVEDEYLAAYYSDKA